MATAKDISTAQPAAGNRRLWYVAGGIMVVLILAVGASLLTHASPGVYNQNGINTGDTAWVLAASVLVMIMTPAVGCFYGGMVSNKSAGSVLQQWLVIFALVSVQWILIGYSLVFGKDIGAGLLGGGSFWGLNGVGYAPFKASVPIPQLAYMIFEAMFAILTPTLIIGAIAERMSLRTLTVFVLLWSTLVYDPIAHWVWSDAGWLSKLHVLDFAGGTVVHTSAGFAALIAAWIVGPRIRYQKGEAIAASNVPLTILGAALLWFGWFGFNAGSALGGNAVAVNAFVVTNTSAAVSALIWMALSWGQNRRPSALTIATGAICGLVVATPACGFVSPLSGIVIGTLGGLITYLALAFRKRMNVDDTLDVWAVHGMGGFIGVLLTGFFAESVISEPIKAGANGLLFGNPEQLGIQALAVLVTIAYSSIVTYILLVGIRFASPTGLRIDSEEEMDRPTRD